MIAAIRPRSEIPRIFPAALVILTSILCGRPAAALQVTADTPTDRVEVGDTLAVTVTGSRSDTAGDPPFAGAGLQASPVWQRGGQLARSPVQQNGVSVKSWQFKLIAAVPGTTTVTPVVYLGAVAAFGSQVDSMLGSPLTIVILPRPEPPLWPWLLAGGLLAAIGVLMIRRLPGRTEPEYHRPELPPLAEALEMLDSMKVNRRVDRARQYPLDVERVVQGYLSRRLGMSLKGLTASQITDTVAGHVSGSAVVSELQSLLTRCGESKFGGARIEFDTLTALEQQARQVLEQMDSAWV